MQNCCKRKAELLQDDRVDRGSFEAAEASLIEPSKDLKAAVAMLPDKGEDVKARREQVEKDFRPGRTEENMEQGVA